MAHRMARAKSRFCITGPFRPPNLRGCVALLCRRRRCLATKRDQRRWRQQSCAYPPVERPSGSMSPAGNVDHSVRNGIAPMGDRAAWPLHLLRFIAMIKYQRLEILDSGAPCPQVVQLTSARSAINLLTGKPGVP